MAGLTPLAAENVSAACVAQIRERDPDRFSATLRAHLCFDYLSMGIFSNKSSLQIVFCLRVTFDQFDRLSRTIHNTTIRVFASQRHSDE